MAAVDTCSGAHVDNIVGSTDCILVVFDDKDGITELLEALEGVYEFLVVPLMESDRGLVEDVENPRESRADLGCESYSLAFSSRESLSVSEEREVSQSHSVKERKAGEYLLEYLTRYRLLILG